MLTWLKRHRGWRRLLLAGAIGMGCGLAMLAVLRVPAVQLRLFRWAMAGRPAWSLDASRLSVGPGGGEAQGLNFSMPGLTASAEPVAVELSPSRLLWGKRELHVARVSVNGVRIEVIPSQLALDDSTPFDGLLAALRLPLAWAVGETQVAAEVAVKEAGEELATGRMRITGGGVSAEKAGEFSYELEMASIILPPGPENIVRSKGRLLVVQDAGNGVERVELRGDLRLPRYGGFTPPEGTLELQIGTIAGGERYQGVVELGKGLQLKFDSRFLRGEKTLAGRVELAADQRALAGLEAAKNVVWPDAKASGVMDFEYKLDAAGGLARAEAGFEMPEPGRVRGELAGIGPIGGRLTAEAGWSGAGGVRVDAARLTIGPRDKPGMLTVAVKNAEEARVVLSGLPLAWAAAWFEPLGLSGADGRVEGEWLLRKSDGGLHLESVRPLVAGPVKFSDGRQPEWPALSLSVRAEAEITNETVAWDLKGLRVGAADGSGYEARAQARGDWSRAVGGTIASAAGSIGQSGSDGRPAVVWMLARPLALDRAGMPVPEAAGELVKVSIFRLPLGWVSRWLDKAELAGEWSQAEASLAVEEGGGLRWRTSEPWRFTGLKLTQAGREIFAGEAELAPEVSWAGGKVQANVEGLHVADAAGRKLSGDVSGFWEPWRNAYGAAVNLAVKLPAATTGMGEAGDVTATMRVKAGSAAERVGQVEELTGTVRAGEAELMTLKSEGPMLFATKPTGEVVFSSVAPWRLQTGRLPLSWAHAWLPPALALEGTLAPMEWLIVAEPNVWRLRPTRRLAVEALTVSRGGVALVENVGAGFYPGLDLKIYYTPKPTLQMGWEATLHATEGRLETKAGRALEFEGALGILGNDHQALPQSIDLVSRGDVAALCGGSTWLAHRLPEAGRLTGRLNGGLLGDEPLEVWARAEGVPAAEEKRLLAPVEIAAKGKVDGIARRVDFDVDLKMGDGAEAGDLAFGAKFALGEDTLRIDSALRGKSWDVGETLAWAKAWAGEAEATPAAVPVAGLASRAAGAKATSLGTAFWGPLRGRFDLDIGELRLAPYRVERLRGRVDLDATDLVVRDLAGEMFGGRLAGALRVGHEPGGEGGDHVLDGNLSIERLNTADVVRAAFKNDYGSLDARVNLHTTVSARGFRLWDLAERMQVGFVLDGRGVARLTHPDAGTASTLLVMGGVLTLSPELRALGRLLRKFAEMPVDELRIEGERTPDGAMRLTRVRFDSPQMRLDGTGEVIAEEGEPLAARQVRLTLELGAKDEMGVILGRMKLLAKKADEAGFYRMTQPVTMGGTVGKPDPSAFYDLLARAVAGSRGTWGFIMRQVQREMAKQQAKAAAESARLQRETPK